MGQWIKLLPRKNGFDQVRRSTSWFSLLLHPFEHLTIPRTSDVLGSELSFQMGNSRE